MTPEEKRNRLAQSMTDATFGYFAAATAAYSHIAAEAVRAWANIAEPEVSEPKKPKSWYQPPPPSMRKSTELTSFPMLFNPWMAHLASNWTASPAFPSAVTTWPAAMTMMTAGIPRAVAWPLAEANCASQDVSALTLESLNDAFAAYSSGGGYAMTPVKMGPEPDEKLTPEPTPPQPSSATTTTADNGENEDLVSALYPNMDDATDLMATWNELSQKLAQSWIPPTENVAG